MKNINIPTKNLGKYHIPENCERKTCVDVGANIGDFTTNHVDRFEVIHFYEPFKPCFDIIQKKLKNCKNVYGFNEAVYKESDLKLPMVAHVNNDAGSNALKIDSLNEDWKDELNMVTTVSFPDVLKRIGGRINYLKIDCETSEYHFLIGQDLSTIDYIGIELHWQMGEERYNQLVNHILQTHLSGDNFSYKVEANREVLFRNRNKL